MQPENELSDAGGILGVDAANHVERTAQRFVTHECERITLINEPRIAELTAEGLDLTERRESLQDRLRGMRPPDDPTGERRRKAYYAVAGVLLILTGFAFTVIGFEPFRLGWIGVIYCVGIALVAPFAGDEFLRLWASESFLRWAVTIAFLAAISGGILLAVVRGELLTRKIAAADAPAVVIDDAEPAPAAAPTSFYTTVDRPLRWLMILFGLAIELGGGIAIHRARAHKIVGHKEYEAVKHELAEVSKRLWTVIAEIAFLRNEPGVYTARFWRDFYRMLLTQAVRNGITRILPLLFLACALFSPRAMAADRMNVLVLLDLSASEGMPTEAVKTPFERNADAVAKLLASLPAGSRITVLKITEDSVRDPVPLLSARLADDPGYFGERLAGGQADLVRAWRARAKQLAPTARGTDIIGALHLASEMFKAASGTRKLLVLYSDMRHHTATLDLEAPWGIDAAATIKAVEAQAHIADLTGVTVYVAGANGGGNDLKSWQAVKDFWIAYFAKSGARVAGYSILLPPIPLGDR